MTKNKVRCEIFLAINDEGDWQIGTDTDGALDGLAGAVRLVCLTAKIAPPVIEQAEIDIPDTAGTTEQIEVTAA